jgi:hypothetical protein
MKLFLRISLLSLFLSLGIQGVVASQMAAASAPGKAYVSQKKPQAEPEAGIALGLGIGGIAGMALAILTGSATTAGFTFGLILLSGLLGVFALGLGIYALRRKKGSRKLAIWGIITGALPLVASLGLTIGFLLGFGG